MPLYRSHKFSLQESLETTVIVKNEDDLRKVIRKQWEHWPTSNFMNFSLQIYVYPSKELCFDSRIGWYTHIVMADIIKKNVFVPVGFLSEEL